MFEQDFKNIDGVLWKEAGCTTELDYTERTYWLHFLKYLGKHYLQVRSEGRRKVRRALRCYSLLVILTKIRSRRARRH